MIHIVVSESDIAYRYVHSVVGIGSTWPRISLPARGVHMVTCLIIATQALGGDELAGAITERITTDNNHFHLLVPPKASTPTTSGPIRSTPQRSTSVGVADGHKLAA